MEERLRKTIIHILPAAAAIALAAVFVTAAAQETVFAATPFQKHGALSVKNGKLVDRKGKVFQLKGVSTHGIAWYPEYVSKKTFRTLRDKWKANVVRLAMYTEEYGGYMSGGDKKQLEKVIDRGVSAADELGMYCIIDWHILSDGNPLKHKKAAKKFFAKMSARYAARGNVIYEICNEPNGGATWKDVKKYAEYVIPAIRRNSPDAIILVGTPTWSQDIDKAAADPLKGFDNVMYTFHFYAATHKADLRKRLEKAVKEGVPVFVSEFSITEASGNGRIDKKSAKAWKKLINRNKLSYCAWSISNKNEKSAMIKAGVKKTYGWSAKQLKYTGRWVRKMIRG